MKSARILAGLSVAVVTAAAVALAGSAKPKTAALTGTWECTSHGGSQGDMQFTLYLTEDKDGVTGSVTSPIGSTDITSATYKNHAVEIHIDSPQGNYVLTGKVHDGQVSGDWTVDSGGKGTWEGKKTSSSTPPTQ